MMSDRVRLSRMELAVAVAKLRAQGLTQLEVSRHLGISRTYVAQIEHDPDGAKCLARKRSYRRPCPLCGRMMSGNDGRGPNAPRMCGVCAKVEAHENRVWTQEAITEAIRTYAAKYGRPPSAHEWNPPLARQRFRDDLADRFHEDGCWPRAATVQHEFGSWNAAISAAGYTPLRPGEKYVDRDPSAA